MTKYFLICSIKVKIDNKCSVLKERMKNEFKYENPTDSNANLSSEDKYELSLNSGKNIKQ